MEALQAEIPTLSWDEFLKEFQWWQGEHLTCIGPNNSGKSTLVKELLSKARADGTHPWQTMFATKPKDVVLDEFQSEGFLKLPEWSVAEADLTPKVMLAPPRMKGMVESLDEQRDVFREAMNRMEKQGGWLVYLDEGKYIANLLRLEKECEMLLHQGRSSGISVVSSLQRPRHVPLMMYDQATHLFMWESRDKNIRQRLSEIGGKVDPDVVMDGVQGLGWHEFLYVNPTTGQVAQSKVDL